MLNVNRIIIFVNFILISFATRIYFSKCNYGGFTCVANRSKYRVTYQCPNTETDPIFFIWQFRAIPSIESLTIQNCLNLKLSFQCTSESKPIVNLTVSNITNLILLKTVNSHLPPNVVFKNIKQLEYIPENTFSQIKHKMPVSGCLNPVQDFQNLLFENITIGTIATRAFNEIRNFVNFTWTQVNVMRFQHLSLEINQIKNFTITESQLEVCEPLAMKITGQQAVFSRNKFIDLASSSINGTIRTFIFTMNRVNNIQPYGFSLLSEKIHISDNRFEYLRSGAFEKISPGLLENSNRNFGNLKFIYDFSFNTINFLDSGSLNPDMQAYDNVATELKFHHNSLFCSCENLGWLFSGVGFGYYSGLMQEFYDTIVEEEFKNWCLYTSCELGINDARNLIENGKCLENKTAEDLCVKKKNLVDVVEELAIKSIANSYQIINNFLSVFIFIVIIIFQ